MLTDTIPPDPTKPDLSIRAPVGEASAFLTLNALLTVRSGCWMGPVPTASPFPDTTEDPDVNGQLNDQINSTRDSE